MSTHEWRREEAVQVVCKCGGLWGDLGDSDGNTLGCGVVEKGQLRHYHNGRVDVTNMT